MMHSHITLYEQLRFEIHLSGYWHFSPIKFTSSNYNFQIIDPYYVLGLAPGASMAELSKRFKKLALCRTHANSPEKV